MGEILKLLDLFKQIVLNKIVHLQKAFLNKNLGIKYKSSFEIHILH